MNGRRPLPRRIGFDLLNKLGREDDAYHATCLILKDYADEAALSEAQAEPADTDILENPGPELTKRERTCPRRFPTSWWQTSSDACARSPS